MAKKPAITVRKTIRIISRRSFVRAFRALAILVLLIAARLLRAPLFFFATGSMANVGGAVSAPIVAGVYHPAMAPIGLLMAVAGYALGIYAGFGCAWLLAWIAT